MTNNHLSYATLSGPKLRAFLQGYITCDLDELQPGIAMPMAITEIKGRVVANGWVFEKDECLVLVVHVSVVDIVQKHLLPYMRFARCEISVEDLPIYICSDVTNVPTKLFVHGQEFGFTSQKTRAHDLDAFQIETGYALVTAATSGKFLPQMLNLTDFDSVSFSKGCYLGQEVVARAQHRGAVKRRLFLSAHELRDVAIGDQVKTQHGDKAVVVACGASAALVVLATSADDNDLRLIAEPVS